MLHFALYYTVKINKEMKQKIFFSIIVLSLVFFPFLETKSSSQLSEEEREVLLEQYHALRERLNYLRWYVQKFDLEREIKAESYLVLNTSDSSFLLEKRSTAARPIASITKLMTAIIASENIDPEQQVTLVSEMFLSNSYQRQSPAIFPGTTLRANDLLKASLIQSTNNAAQSLTHFLTEEEFIKIMNEKTKEIGMESTYFHDAHGLSPLNISSANDLAKLLDYISENHPEILEITKEENFQLPGKCPEYNWICTFKNLNVFHEIEEFAGGKTGYTNAAGYSFAGKFKPEETSYAVIMLGAPDIQSRKSSIQKIYEWLKSSPL